ncbi:flavin reductase [Herbaspirillum robiniae]|uniref:Flavin reductase n=1 Tax=Herbaspirillum robiniae TaxID=2014887 RepID=A0A246WKW2_9BURK|nr:flavin reductase [Herbaspirillum robiniae]NUU02113.1 flavin reductase [Herbaspirillum robiniae]OWY26889.1 flavin reductase [Herbaspirillum robiniae]
MAQASPSDPTQKQAFRDAMSRLGAAVNIVTTDGPAGRHGLTVSAVCSVTDEPPTLLVCINQSAGAHDVVAANGRLCVNVLGAQHESLSDAFGRRGLSTDERYARARWGTLQSGAPVLADAAVSLDCKIARAEQVGTHSVFFCSVLDIAIAGEPNGLIYFNRLYHPLGPAHAVAAR